MMRRYDNKIMLMVLMVMMAGWFCGGWLALVATLQALVFALALGFCCT